MKAVKTKLQEEGKPDSEVKAFESGAQKFVKEKLLANFKDYEFYTGESMNPDGMVALLNYRYAFFHHSLNPSTNNVSIY